MSPLTVGIDAMNAYCGVARISARTLFDARGLDPSRFDGLIARQRSVQLPWEDPVTNAVNAARPLIDAMGDDLNRIELLITSTESGIDYSKSVASYVQAQLGLTRRCRVLEVKQACYGATGAAQLAAGYLRSSGNPESRALVIATDVNPMDERAQYAEPTTGHGAVALLIGANPNLLSLESGASGLCSFDVMDTARPRPDFDLYNTELSLLSYLECLTESYRAYIESRPETDLVKSFDYLAMHTPFGGMVKAAHRKLMRENGMGQPSLVQEDFDRRVAPSLTYVRDVGNLCSGSLYLALAGILDSLPADSGQGARVGMYSYGSGCASEFYCGIVGPRALPHSGLVGIADRLERRRELTFAEYEHLIPSARDCIVPRESYRPDLSWCDEILKPYKDNGPFLVLKDIVGHRRQYQWY